jgi:hypothetical protein
MRETEGQEKALYRETETGREREREREREKKREKERERTGNALTRETEGQQSSYPYIHAYIPHVSYPLHIHAYICEERERPEKALDKATEKDSGGEREREEGEKNFLPHLLLILRQVLHVFFFFLHRQARVYRR